ncbi:MAG: hypothetical protein K0R66_1395 [Gammaproteobacteria bacterium]|jgi:hypothetical protein|nr:hypothetical protein [Gammaproteobacteria bacterium]
MNYSNADRLKMLSKFTCLGALAGLIIASIIARTKQGIGNQDEMCAFAKNTLNCYISNDPNLSDCPSFDGGHACTSSEINEITDDSKVSTKFQVNYLWKGTLAGAGAVFLYMLWLLIKDYRDNAASSEAQRLLTDGNQRPPARLSDMLAIPARYKAAAAANVADTARIVPAQIPATGAVEEDPQPSAPRPVSVMIMSGREQSRLYAGTRLAFDVTTPSGSPS